MATQTNKKTPTWIIVVIILILAGPAIWALTIAINLVAAMSIVGILLVVAFIALFVYVNKRVNG